MKSDLLQLAGELINLDQKEVAALKILSEPQIEARNVSENEQTKEVCVHDTTYGAGGIAWCRECGESIIDY